MYAKLFIEMGLGQYDADIYHDPETRRESITYRTNPCSLELNTKEVAERQKQKVKIT
jgi:hypothetical protein